MLEQNSRSQIYSISYRAPLTFVRLARADSCPDLTAKFNCKRKNLDHKIKPELERRGCSREFYFLHWIGARKKWGVKSIHENRGMPSREAQEDNGCNFSWIGSWAAYGKRNSPLEVIKNTCINILLWITICRSLIFTDCVGSLGRPANSLSYQSEVPEVSWSEVLGGLSLLVLVLRNKTQDKWSHWSLQTSVWNNKKMQSTFTLPVHFPSLRIVVLLLCFSPSSRSARHPMPGLSPAFVLCLSLTHFCQSIFILSI